MTPSGTRILLASHWYYMEALHEGATRRCAELGWETRVLTTDTVATVAKQPFHGILGPLPREADHPVRRLAEASGVPIVEPMPAYDKGGLRAWYPSDGVAVGRIAADYLRRLPVASFLFLSDCENEAHAERRTSFFSALAGDARPCVSVVTPESDPDAAAALSDLLKRQSKPVAVFGSVDRCARQALDAALAAGLSVPGDIYILGYGDRAITCENAPVPLSSLAIDYRAWGYAATGLLAGLIDGRILPGETRSFPPGAVVERASTVGVSAEALLCARAVALMRSRPEAPLTVSELAARLNVSRTKFIRVFSAAHGEGVAAYDLKLRLDLAKSRLLAGEKASGVAASVGFDSYRAFGDAFKKYTGFTPRGFTRESA